MIPRVSFVFPDMSFVPHLLARVPSGCRRGNGEKDKMIFMTAIEAPEREATIEDLYRAEGKAELIGGRVVLFMSTGEKPGYASDVILTLLFAYARGRRTGRAVGDNKGFLCDLPHRKSFSPDAAYYTGSLSGMRFYPEPPIFAVEVRSEGDYGPSAEEKMEAKRADYFAAGTQVVWDVDLLNSEAIIRKFNAPDSVNPSEMFGRGQTADAETAVPGWTLAVDELFDSE